MADPWMKFFPADWMSEPKLKLVSRAARSLWIDMICLMHQSGTGRLEISGRPMTEKEIASILGDNPRTIKKLIAELMAADVSTIVDGSFIASSRVIRDFEKAEKDRSNGRMGGNPSLKTAVSDDLGVNPEVKAQKPESESDTERKKEPPAKADAGQAGTDFQKGKSGKNWIWSEGVDHLIRTTDKNTDQAKSTIGHLLKMCDEKPDRLVKYFIHALQQGSDDLVASVKAQVGVKLAKAASGTDRSDLVAVGFTDGRYKPLQARHEAELGKRKFVANGVSHFPKAWVDEMAGIGG